MKVMILGATGQAGQELFRTAPAEAEFHGFGSAALDIRDERAVAAEMARLRPEVVVNAAAYTMVDRAEEERQQAFAVNAAGAGNVARAAARTGAYLVHLSTDFVFSGASARPYRPQDRPEPANVYGGSKLAGEQEVMAASVDFAVLRTAWLYSGCGRNFVTTMLRLMADNQEVRVVADQIGTPTWARGLARAVWRLAARRLGGIYHWTDAGVASWYDFAVAIQEEALGLGLLAREAAVVPIAGSDYPTPARRPACSLLDKHATWQALGLPPVHWRVMLRRMLTEHREGVDG